MIISIRGGTSMGATSKNYLLYIQHHPSNRLSSASFEPPSQPKKSLWQQFIELINRRLEP
ncbi:MULTISPECIES: hypothetical protein [Yersinia]|uniref:hypothetical protein n=1 Tax=Yersinia TaxID=629 RepID=UPI001C60FA8A|nr:MULTISPECIES: hypothetical protein [Yersinia]MBW5814624.1 hypothetical protein [Yersinia kristensenii]MBW5818916.1 hypothetical protein [Yersinia kristensenii]MBW5823318.1 hypothetical protein [Yersinia enterocolitica]MBW5831772.1 hypothetical protein [Yersinia kristensenii]MBW5844532.1 hypothetical protein [Yersinia kristensenii]